MAVPRGVSTAVIAVVLVVLVVAAGLAYFLFVGPGGSPTTTTSTNTSSATLNSQQVTAQIQAFQTTFNNRSQIGQLPNFYTQSAVVVWGGSAGGEAGTTSGRGNIGLLFDATIGKTTSLAVTMSNIQTTVVNSNQINSTIDIFMTGTSTVLGNFNATIKASQEWVNQGGQVLIQAETWDYISLKAQNNVGATVFPQWGLQLTGNSPNLAQEHTLEWGLAPYMAIGIYIVIAAVITSAIWVRARKHKK